MGAVEIELDCWAYKPTNITGRAPPSSKIPSIAQRMWVDGTVCGCSPILTMAQISTQDRYIYIYIYIYYSPPAR